MTAPSLAKSRGFDAATVRRLLPVYGVYVALAVLVLFNIAWTDNFLAWNNLRIQLVQVTPVVIVALGMALVIGTEGIDLSVGSVMALGAALIPLYLGYGMIPAIALAVVGGVFVGLVNGGLVAFVGLQPIVATLAMLVAGRGIALVVSNGKYKDIRDKDFLAIGTDAFLGVPYTVWIAAVLAVVVGFVVRRTVFGRRLLAVGDNRAAAQLAGVPVKRVLITVYVIAAVLAAIAGVIQVSRIGSADASRIGLLIELSAITAVVVGGTPLTGGKVRVLGTVAGAFLMQLLTATMIANNLKDSTAQMVQAVIILVAVYTARERRTR
ncbi:ABC transporter permease [Dactylosporangium siamense]|uniref:Sugar ABC transporter permease n=1 Tax=Dactylosporangium siamense TaxID=685454 RepID=A0A919UCV6_9ACTN|nr:ABC transporter permease [Dactylosporangium siamense]GIG46003.1 sugar ABC transporter permease [Dactylosporangium siamense]